jgi:Uma2 family endonuclease
MNEHVTAARRPATYQDVLDAPPHMVAELVRGALHLQPRPASPHAHAASALGIKLGNPFRYGEGGPGGWWILDEPELHLGEDVLVPDLAGWRRARMPAFPSVAFFELAPDWACEVLSPGTRRLDLTEKREIYGAAGVGHLWLVDPLARTLEAFALRGGAWVLAGAVADDAEVRLPPFEAVGFPLAALWPDEARPA